MIIKLAKAIWIDYLPKLTALFQEREQRNKDLYALGVQSGDAILQLREDFIRFEERQFQIFLRLLEIYQQTESALEEIDKGTPIQDSTGLPRTIGDPSIRAEVKKYFYLMQSSNSRASV